MMLDFFLLFNEIKAFETSIIIVEIPVRTRCFDIYATSSFLFIVYLDFITLENVDVMKILKKKKRICKIIFDLPTFYHYNII